MGASLLVTTNQLVAQWGTVSGDEVLSAAILVDLRPTHQVVIGQPLACSDPVHRQPAKRGAHSDLVE